MARTNEAALAVLILLSACDQAPTAAPAAEASATATPVAAAPAMPDLARCERYEPIPDAERQRATPLAVPAALKDVMASDMDHVAIATLGGETVCVDARYMDSIDKAALSKDGRFAQFDWSGYEAYGHILVDRAGSGRAVDTGVAPIASPSGKRIAALEWSESGFGSLNGLGVWDMSARPLKDVALIEDLADAPDWNFDGWRGDDCIALSSNSFDDMPEEGDAPANRHHKYLARVSGGKWTLGPDDGSCPAK